ncbi:GntR family transcriptional regulator [Lichenifustis flavocetrariae]|uniref:FCD domain-containing protein n=1 Tax=Lichenifustis flavocetrariae TaxID=2949735 RepID=A0AA42CQ92_9HYPH|nr:FCD domain-containing protein [Lichenifustis flavocetrariae]MCW6511222.1 FCD domain-containing protein [Lichenifustis flavocetrariae]
MRRLEQIGRGNLSTQVYKQLRAALMSGFYEPGQRLLIIDLAEEMGTSVTPVREAIFRLVADGALEMQKVQAVTVPMLSDEQIAEVRTIRIALEGEAAALAARKVTGRQIADITRINDAFFSALRDGDPHQASELNREFHLAVVSIAEMPTLSSMVEMMWARMGALIHRINLNLRVSQDYGPDHDHYKVIEGLKTGDADLARQGIQNDIRFSRIGILTPHGDGEAPQPEKAGRRRRKMPAKT